MTCDICETDVQTIYDCHHITHGEYDQLCKPCLMRVVNSRIKERKA